MPSNDGLISDLAGAILDGTPIDWASAESCADDTQRPLLDQLRLLATVTQLHRGLPHSSRVAPVDPNCGPVDPDDHIKTLEHWGHLRVLERIGRGAFGEVYRAWDTRLDREVALKLLPAVSTSGDWRGTTIIEEGRLLARVRHPNVVTIYGAERIENRIGLWMELVRGRTLQQALEQGKVFTPIEAVRIGIELCHAIGAVHSAGLLHRDIKPHNVMLAEDARVVLMDFGAGRELNNPPPAALAGTPLYLAPELLCGKEPTVRSDMYSLGVLLFYLLTRSYPVRAQSLGELRLAHERIESRDVRVVRPDVPRGLARVIERAIDPQPERRHQSANRLAADLALATTRPKLVPASQLPEPRSALIGREQDSPEDVLEDQAEGSDDVGENAENRSQARSLFPTRSRSLSRGWIGLLVGSMFMAVVGTSAVRYLSRADSSHQLLRPVPVTSLPGMELAPALSWDGNHVAFLWNGGNSQAPLRSPALCAAHRGGSPVEADARRTGCVATDMVTGREPNCVSAAS